MPYDRIGWSRVKEDYFTSSFNMRSRELPEMLEEMDAHGVRRAVLLTNSTKPSTRAQAFVEAHPEWFSLGLGGHNLLKPMPTLKALESFVASNPVAYVNVGPSFWGDGRYPPTDAVYFPLSTKCCELDIHEHRLLRSSRSGRGAEPHLLGITSTATARTTSRPVPAAQAEEYHQSGILEPGSRFAGG
jgi:hypothetical protein